MLLATIALLASCTREQGITLSGTIANSSGETIYLERIDLDGFTKEDSCVLSRDGKFNLEASPVSEPTFFRAVVGAKMITFLADSLENVVVTADINDASWLSSIAFQNSPESQKLQEIIQKASVLEKELTQYVKKIEKIDEQTRKAANDSMVIMIDEYKKFVEKVVFENYSSFVSYYALFQNVLDMPVLDVMNEKDQTLFSTVATSLKIKYPNSVRVKDLYDYVLFAKATQKRKKMNDELLSTATEVKSPDLNLPNLDGENIKLSSLQGKIVILQFWASSVEEARASNRQLAKLYEKYKKNGLEIYSVSFDTSKLLWEDAMLKDKVTWKSVCDLQGQYSVAARLYNVSKIPSNYIIGRDGSLIGKDLFGTRLDNKIAELMK
jgi:peroxiredoxin